MKNKKIIALTMTAATVYPMTAPVFASNIDTGYANVRTVSGKNVSNTGSKNSTASLIEMPIPLSNVLEGYVNVRTANGRELSNRTVRETNLNQYLLANSNKNPIVVGKLFINGEPNYIVEQNMDMTQTENKNLKIEATKTLTDLKTNLEQLSKEQYNGEPRYKFEVKEYTPSLTPQLSFYDGCTVVYVTDKKDSSQPVKAYIFQGVYKFNEKDIVNVVRDVIDFNPCGDINDPYYKFKIHGMYKKLGTTIYELKKALGQNKVYITTEIDDEYIEDMHPSYKIHIYSPDKKVLIGQLLIAAYDLIDTNILNKYYTIPQVNDFNGHWAEFNIIDAMQNQYVNLTANFRPEESITRAEFAKIVCTVLGQDLNNIKTENSFNFSDVKKEDWYYDYIEILAKKGIIRGYGDGTFKPNDTIKRQEAAVILASIKGIKEDTYTDINGKVIHKDTLTNFDDDKSIPTWVDKSVNELSKLGVINGYKEGDKVYFKPANQIKRAEALVMIQRSKIKIEHK